MPLIQPSVSQQVSIREALNEDVRTRDRDVGIIKEWLGQQPHLPSLDDSSLMSFLRGSRFSLEACKRKLEMYFTVRATMPEFFAHRDLRRPELQRMLELMDAAVIPTLTPDGKRVTVAKASRLDFDTPDIADLIKIIFMVGDLRLRLEKHGVLCDVYVADAGFPLARHFFKINPLTLKKMFVCIQEAYPVMIGEIHIINAPAFVDFISNVIKPYMSDSLRNSIHIHRDTESLYDFIPRDILPEEFGGRAGGIADMKQKWLRALEDNALWFREQEDVKIDFSKISDKGDPLNGPFGFDGSFRQLCVD